MQQSSFNREYFLEKFEESRKADKFNILWSFRKELSIQEFSELLRYWWIQMDFPNQYPKYMLLDLFKQSDRKILNESYEEEFNLMSDPIKVYRGVQDCSKIGKMKVKAFSWTIDKDVALWFSKRWDKENTGHLCSSLIYKKDVFMYNNGRGEKEIVLNPNKLMELKE